ncbi:MAG TPA: hypothetical protein VGL94_10710 [Ktedonobacteraceae bacterium]|jgi:hypothetical protein
MPNYATILPSGGYLNPGESVVSGNQSIKLILQSDGDLTLYQNETLIWDTGTHIATSQQPPQCRMQQDGNLVLYDVNNVAYWASGTYQDYNSVLVVEDEGNAVVFQPVWSALPMVEKKKKGAGVLLTR